MRHLSQLWALDAASSFKDGQTKSSGDHALARCWGEVATKTLRDLVYTNEVDVYADYVFLASASCSLERIGDRRIPKS